MLRYKTETRPGLVALYDIGPGNGVSQFLEPRARTGHSVTGRRPRPPRQFHLNRSNVSCENSPTSSPLRQINDNDDKDVAGERTAARFGVVYVAHRAGDAEARPGHDDQQPVLHRRRTTLGADARRQDSRRHRARRDAALRHRLRSDVAGGPSTL